MGKCLQNCVSNLGGLLGALGSRGKVDDDGQGAVQGLHSFGLGTIWCQVTMRKL